MSNTIRVWLVSSAPVSPSVPSNNQNSIAELRVRSMPLGDSEVCIVRQRGANGRFGRVQLAWLLVPASSPPAVSACSVMKSTAAGARATELVSLMVVSMSWGESWIGLLLASGT